GSALHWSQSAAVPPHPGTPGAAGTGRGRAAPRPGRRAGAAPHARRESSAASGRGTAPPRAILASAAGRPRERPRRTPPPRPAGVPPPPERRGRESRYPAPMVGRHPAPATAREAAFARIRRPGLALAPRDRPHGGCPVRARRGTPPPGLRPGGRALPGWTRYRARPRRRSLPPAPWTGIT